MGTKTQVDTNFGITVAHQISRESVGNLLASAFEGGSNYWYSIEEKKAPSKYEQRFMDDGTVFYHIDYPLNPDGYLMVSDANGLSEGDKKRVERLDLNAIRLGLHLFANSKDYAHHWRDFITENDDATTADVFLQFCVFGEVVYG